jgi:hypothetical protein
MQKTPDGELSQVDDGSKECLRASLEVSYTSLPSLEVLMPVALSNSAGCSQLQ